MALNKSKRYFFGWTNIQFLIKEVIKIYSTRPSFFSKKRIESGIAFIIAQWGMIFFLLEKHSLMTSSDLAIWVGIEFAVSGYILTHIQREKKRAPDDLK